MSLRNHTDPAAAAPRLEVWLSRNVADGATVTVTSSALSSASGMSNETLLFDAGWGERSRRLVARISPRDAGIFPTYDLVREHRVLDALAEHSSVPVPRVLAREDSAETLGAPFLVMEAIDGLTLADDPPFTVAGWMLELAPEHRARLNDNALKVLVELHRADPDAMRLDDLDPRLQGEDVLDAYLRSLRSFAEWASATPNPVIEAGFTWLSEHRPADESPAGLIWGDARLGNLLFDDHGTVTAALDWENAEIGVPEIDLGWWLVLLRHHTEGIGAPLPDGLLDTDQTVARYEELSGRAVEHITFYEVLAAVRLSIMMARAAVMMAELGMIGPDSTMALNNPATQILGTLIGFGELAGTRDTFIGRRS